MLIFDYVLTLLCTSMNIGCLKLGTGPFRVTSVVPYYDNYNQAFSGTFSFNTTHLFRKLNNPANFGPNGIAKFPGFEFKELNLDAVTMWGVESEVVNRALAETDILYIGPVHSRDIANFEDEITAYIQNKSVVLLLALNYEWQNYYTGDLGYTLDQHENNTILPVRTTGDFTGPFGEPRELFLERPLIRFAKSPSQATPILTDSIGVQRAMQEDNKVILGDGKLLLNTYVRDGSNRCDSDDYSIFVCNLFASLLQKVKNTKS